MYFDKSQLSNNMTLNYLKIGACSVTKNLLGFMGEMLIYIGNNPNFHLPYSLRLA